MYNSRRISIVMPCYNEEKGLEKILINKIPFIDEIVVVDNDSNDKTAEVAKRHGARVVFLKKKGYGLACQKGLKEATGDILIMMDGDNTYPFLETKNLLSDMETNGYDFLTGCRFPLADKKDMPYIKRISNYFISWLIRRLFRINLTDSQSGMLVLKREILPEILPSNPGMAFSHEIKIKAWLNPDIRCGESRIDLGQRIGKVKFRPIRDGLSSLYSVFKTYLNYYGHMKMVRKENTYAKSNGFAGHTKLQRILARLFGQPH